MRFLNHTRRWIPLLGFLLPLPLFSQDVLWEKSLGGKHADYLLDAVATPDNGFILAGASVSGKTGAKTEDNRGNLDYLIWKISGKGDPEWQKTFGGTGFDMLQTVQLTPDGGYIIGGSSDSPKGLDKEEESKGKRDYWIIKLDAKGGQQWQKTYGGNGQDELKRIVLTSDGGYLLAGTSDSGISGDKTEKSFGSTDYWLLKINKDGKIEWQRTLGGAYAEICRDVVKTPDGFLVGGWSNSPVSGIKTEDNNGIGDFWIVMVSEKGELLWQKTIGGDQDDHLQAICRTADNGFLLAGNSSSSASVTKSIGNKNGTDLWVVRLGNDGKIEWQQTYNIGKEDMLASVIENPDRSFLIGAYARFEKDSKKSQKKGVNDFAAIKIDAQGEEVWRKIVGSNGDEILRKAFETRDGGYVFAGISDGPVSRDKNTFIGGRDFWVVKLKDKDKPEKPAARIEAVPNPTSEFTNVVLGFDYERGSAQVYDLSGRQLQDFKISGRTIPVDLSSLPMGIYIVQVNTDVSSEAIKVMKSNN